MARSLSDLIYMLEIGAHCQLGDQWGLSARRLSFPCGPLHISTCASSQNGDWVSKGGIISSKAGICADLLRSAQEKLYRIASNIFCSSKQIIGAIHFQRERK